MLDAAIRVVISASAATPAPQQLRAKGGSVWTEIGRAGTGVRAKSYFLACWNWAGGVSLDFGGDEVDLLAILVCHNRIVSGPGIRAQDDPVLRGRRGRAQCLPVPLYLTAPLPTLQSHSRAHSEHKACDGGTGLACMRGPEPGKDAFQVCISGNRGK